MSGILLELPSGKIIRSDHKVGPVFGLYGTFATVFAFPYEIKQPLESIEILCVKNAQHTELEEQQDLHQPNKALRVLT